MAQPTRGATVTIRGERFANGYIAIGPMRSSTRIASASSARANFPTRSTKVTAVLANHSIRAARSAFASKHHVQSLRCTGLRRRASFGFGLGFGGMWTDAKIRR